MAKTIMVVDDEPDNITTVRAVLEKNGYNVVAAVNGDDCLRKFPKQKVDLVLMDIMMPGTPVRDVVKKLKSVKIAYLSVVRVSDAEREDILRSGKIVDYIQKPYDVSELLARVKKIVGK